MQNTLALINPMAGGGMGARRAGPLQDWLRQHAPDVRTHVASSVEDSLQTLQNLPQKSRVVLVGGDGTINTVLPALLERQHSLALVPSGSGNDCARTLGLGGMHWRDALALAVRASASAWDVGWVSGDGLHRPFASSLTAGFDSAVGHRALLGPKGLRGLPRYLLATMRELSSLQTWPLQVWLDGQLVHRGATLFASSLNTPTYASGMPAVPHANPSDGQLDLLIAGEFTRLGALSMLPRLLMGKHIGHPRIQTHPYTHMKIQTAVPVPLATDGEYIGVSAQIEVRVQAGGLQVVRAANSAPP